MPVPAKFLLVVLAHIGGPFLAHAGGALIPAPEPDPAMPRSVGNAERGDRAGTAQIAVSIVDDVDEVSAGQRIRYHIKVNNPTAAEAPVTVKLTLPPASVEEIKAEDATVVANAVAWRKVIPAGQTWTHTVAGTVEHRVQREDLEARVCLHQDAGAPAVACASDRNTVVGPPVTDKYAWPAAVALGILAVIGALWLYRKVNPEPLTPANAAAAYGELPAGLPGGAPPV